MNACAFCGDVRPLAELLLVVRHGTARRYVCRPSTGSGGYCFRASVDSGDCDRIEVADRAAWDRAVAARGWERK